VTADTESTEVCYKCQGERGAVSIEGPHTLWHPCFRCGNTGVLPVGSLADDTAKTCPECLGAGGADVDSEDGPYFRQCRACKGSGLRPEAFA